MRLLFNMINVNKVCDIATITTLYVGFFRLVVRVVSSKLVLEMPENHTVLEFKRDIERVDKLNRGNLNFRGCSFDSLESLHFHHKSTHHLMEDTTDSNGQSKT